MPLAGGADSAAPQPIEPRLGGRFRLEARLDFRRPAGPLDQHGISAINVQHRPKRPHVHEPRSYGERRGRGAPLTRLGQRAGKPLGTMASRSRTAELAGHRRLLVAAQPARRRAQALLLEDRRVHHLALAPGQDRRPRRRGRRSDPRPLLHLQRGSDKVLFQCSPAVSLRSARRGRGDVPRRAPSATLNRYTIGSRLASQTTHLR